MAVAAARLSPAASLLRNSRLFALPPSLSPPVEDISAEPEGRSSTATLPYPTRAAIETPKQSLERGDWGLKRPLPLKSTTKSGTPVIRIQGGIDTHEHIADFESAADHALTLRKWQELHMPLSTPDSFSTDVYKIGTTVFDSARDNISAQTAEAATRTPETGVWPHIRISSLNEAEGVVAFKSNEPTKQTAPILAKRWRYEGPWLAGMTGLQFEYYLEHVVRHRMRGEFRDKVVAKMKADKESKLRREALESGEGVGSQVVQVQFTEEQISDYIRTLRSKPEAFGPIITELLDLADGPTAPKDRIGMEKWEYGRNTRSARVYAEQGPPKTHPSAGLSYLKLGPSQYVRNDAVLGPQNLPAPVPGRILKVPRGPSGRGDVGIAGVVADRIDHLYNTGRRSFEPFQPKKGGHKRAVRPSNASITSNGTISLDAKIVGTYELSEDDKVQLEGTNEAVARSKEPPASISPLAEQFRGRIMPPRSMPRLDEDFDPPRRDTLSSGSGGLRESLQQLNKKFDPFGQYPGRQ